MKAVLSKKASRILSNGRIARELIQSSSSKDTSTNTTYTIRKASEYIPDQDQNILLEI